MALWGVGDGGGRRDDAAQRGSRCALAGAAGPLLSVRPQIPRGIRDLQDEVRESERARAILAASRGQRPYAKWRGSHWALLALAAIGYPPGDSNSYPLRDAVLDNWLAPRYLRDQGTHACDEASRRRLSRVFPGVPVDARRSRAERFWLSWLGVDDGRAATLAQRLRDWQWPDGGWNWTDAVDEISSVDETLLAMRGLSASRRRDGSSARGGGRRSGSVPHSSRRLAQDLAGTIAADVIELHFPRTGTTTSSGA